MKLQKMNNKQFFITLPNAIINAKGWIKGDKIRVLLDQKGDIILKKDSNIVHRIAKGITTNTINTASPPPLNASSRPINHQVSEEFVFPDINNNTKSEIIVIPKYFNFLFIFLKHIIFINFFLSLIFKII